ncbi:MAG: triphosphoribosyl-dephospho-CoA synthase CitG [Oscillospiraceae bacterium]
MSEISLQQMLDAREQRAKHQTTLLQGASGGCMVSFTLNIAGPQKHPPFAHSTFVAGVQRLDEVLQHHNILVVKKDVFYKDTGDEAYYLLNADVQRIKSLTCQIEEHHPLGRLFDMDVLYPDGTKAVRQTAGLSTRQCLLCQNPAKVCARSRTHTVEQLTQKTQQIMQGYFYGRFGHTIQHLAQKALLMEVDTTPKPGLVDRSNNGAHYDMDIHTFYASTRAISPFFKTFALQGLICTKPLPCFLEELRPTGLLAEKAMCAATNGINTHKGAIFSLGILCAAAGYVYANKQALDVAEICHTAAHIAAPALAQIQNMSFPLTNGEKAFTQNNLTGARGEAASGFKTVLCHGLPALQRALAGGLSLNDAGAICLLHILASAQDTNVAARASGSTLQAIQQRLQNKLNIGANYADLLAFAAELDTEFIGQNLSPGGSADLLAVTYFLHFISKSKAF